MTLHKLCHRLKLGGWGEVLYLAGTLSLPCKLVEPPHDHLEWWNHPLDRGTVPNLSSSYKKSKKNSGTQKNCCNHPKMSLVMRKPVFGICDQVRFKPACAATEARYRLESSDIESRGIILSRQWTTKELMRLRGCADWSAPLLFAYAIKKFLMTWLKCKQGGFTIE